MITVKEYFIDRDYTFSYVREDAPGNPFYHCYKLIATNNSTKVEIDTKLRIFIQPYEKIRNLNVEITNENNIKKLETELAITKDETLDLYFPGFITNEKDRRFISLDLSSNISIDNRIHLHVEKVNIEANDQLSIVLNTEAPTTDHAYIKDISVASNSNVKVLVEKGIYEKPNRPCHQLKIKNSSNSSFIFNSYFGRVEIDHAIGSSYGGIGSNPAELNFGYHEKDENGGIISIKNLNTLIDFKENEDDCAPTFYAPITIIENCDLKVKAPTSLRRFRNRIEHNKEILIKNVKVELSGALLTSSNYGLEIRAPKDDFEKKLYDKAIIIEGNSSLSSDRNDVSLNQFGLIKDTFASAEGDLKLYQFYLDKVDILDDQGELVFINTKIVEGRLSFPKIVGARDMQGLVAIKDLELYATSLESPIFDFQTKNIKSTDELSRKETIDKQKKITIKARDGKRLQLKNAVFTITKEDDYIDIDSDITEKGPMYASHFENCYFYGKNKITFKEISFASSLLFANSDATIKNFKEIKGQQLSGLVALDGKNQTI